MQDFLMAKVTGKFQITIPKRLAELHGIKVGDEVDIVSAGDRITIIPVGARDSASSAVDRLHYFDQATRRQQVRERSNLLPPASTRGWTRDELNSRGRSR
jgi:AbrB family looped-hinge helix DNA binding protein